MLKKDLKKAIDTLSSITPNKTDKPILKNIIIEQNAAGIHCKASNIELTAIIKLNDIPGPDKIVLIDCSKFKKLLSKIKSKNIGLILHDSELEITTDNKSYTIKSENSENIELLQDTISHVCSEPAKSNIDNLPADFINKSFKDLSCCIDPETTAYTFDGFALHCTTELFCIVATDGKRLARAALPGNYENIDFQLIPAASAKIISKLLTGPVNIAVCQNHIYFKSAGVFISSRLLDGRFPEYMDYLPDDEKLKSSIELDRSEAIEALDICLVYSDIDTNLIKYTAGNKLELETNGGKFKTELDYSFTGNIPDIFGFNGRHFLELFKMLDSDRVKIELCENQGPAVYRDATLLYICMPVKLR